MLLGGRRIPTFPEVKDGDSLHKKSFVSNLKYILLRKLETSACCNAFRKYAIIILVVWLRWNYLFVEPASLCRPAGEDSNLMCFSSAAETEWKLSYLVFYETGSFGGSCWAYMERYARYYYYLYLAIENIYYLVLMWYHKTTWAESLIYARLWID